MGRCPSNARHKNHLGLTGTLDLINKLDPKPNLVIISEFGEEFSGLRADLCDAIAEAIAGEFKIPVIPASAKLHLKFAEGTEPGIDIKIRCTGTCGNFTELNKTRIREQEGLLDYYCPDCYHYAST